MHKRRKLKVTVGDLLPEIILSSTKGQKLNLPEEAKKSKLVLFFFPGYGVGKQYTELAGCTLEGKTFRDNYQQIQKLGAKVFGISLQSTNEQKKFVENEKLNFELINDKKKKLTNYLGVPLWTTPSGEEYTARTTFIISKGGKIEKILENVVSEGHVQEVIKLLK